MTITDKTDETIHAIRQFMGMQKYVAPVLNWSGGKDSTVMLHLFHKHVAHLPVIFYEDPWFPAKTQWMHELAASWALEVHNYPPLRVSLKTSPEMVALVNEYSTGPHSIEAMLKNTIEYDEKETVGEFLCGVSFLSRPCGTFNYPFDLAIIGHKDVDTDQIYGPIPLHSELVMRDSGPDFYFPLKGWTHDDVWDYIEVFDIPVQRNRYDVSRRQEWDDKTFNSDWYPCCLRCVDKRKEGQRVFCPKAQLELINMSGLVPEWDWEPDYFGEKKT